MAAQLHHHVLIVKLSSLGDIVHALPVASSLRATWPQARIAWVVERKWLPLVARHPDLDEVFAIDSHALRARNTSRQGWVALRMDLRRLREFHPDCALDLQGTLKSAIITRWSGAPLRIGFSTEARRERAAGWFYNRPVTPRASHIVEQMLELAAAIDPHVRLKQELRFSFPIPEAVQRAVDEWIESNRIGRFAFLSPGGGWMSKRWPSERYADLADILERKFGLTVVLNRGPDERDMDDAYRRASQIRARLFSGDVEHLGAILRRARLAIGGDTGPLQLAAALDTPTVALFGPTDPARNGPYSKRCRVIRKSTEVSYERRDSYSAAMLAIKPEEVADVCGALLEAEPDSRQEPDPDTQPKVRAES